HDGRPPEKNRLTGTRALTRRSVRLTGRQVREIWARHFEDREPGHPYWLYTHIPFCPQICSFCQCSTSLRKSDEQVAAYLEWLEGEIEFFADVSQPGLVQFQYVGGGTPNLLSEPQLDRLLGTINRHFRFTSTSRRTFEFLPSSLRPDTLPLVRAHGFNRLSCGVQSWSDQTLKAVNRSRAGLDELGRTIEQAYGLGFDEVNVDLIFGIGGESSRGFLEGLLELLARNPTTVTIHNIIPTATNPVFSSVQEELAAHAAFEALSQTMGDAVARRFPHLEWVLRPNCWVVVERLVRRRDHRWEPVHTDGVFIDPFLPLLETALEGVPPPWSAPGTREAERGIAVSRGARSLLVFIERIRPEQRYFTQIGKLGIYYRDTSAAPVRNEDGLAEQLMDAVVEDVRRLVEQTPNIGPKEATARLRARYRHAAPVR